MQLSLSSTAYPEYKDLDFSDLKMTSSGGTALSPDTAKRWESVTSCQISKGFGLTECSPVVCAKRAGDHIQEVTVGVAVPGKAYKVPRQIEFRKELPMSAVGKSLRKELRAEALAEAKKSA